MAGVQSRAYEIIIHLVAKSWRGGPPCPPASKHFPGSSWRAGTPALQELELELIDGSKRNVVLLPTTVVDKTGEEMRRLFVCVCVLVFTAALCFSGDWPAWRGLDHNGVSTETGLVTQWSAQGENLIWKAGFIGRSTPVVLNGRVYVIGRTGEGITRQEHIACFDAGNGKLIWERRFNVTHTTVPFNRVGWASLAADPETGNIYAHGVGGLFLCLNRDGKTVWQRSLAEEFGHISGFGGRTDTPVVDENQVILGFINSGWGEQAAPRHRFFSFDKKTGEILWISTPGGAPYDLNVQPTPVVTTINGTRMLIGGNADGGIYALKIHTGEKVWSFQLSKRGINTSVVVDGTNVYATHSEENMDEGSQGRIVCIDGAGTGDITKTNEVWRADKIGVGFSSPVFHDGILYAVDNSAVLYAIDAAGGQMLWQHHLGTVGKGSPVWADGKLYVTEVNGNFHILQPSRSDVKVLDTEKINVPGGRYAEIYGSPAIAYGRVYFTTEEGLYCLGDKKKNFKVASNRATAPSPAAQGPSVTILAVPAEVLIKPGDSVTYRVKTFNASGQFLSETPATWTMTGLKGKIEANGIFTPNGNEPQAGVLTAQVGELKAGARVRIIPELPWSHDFESFEEGKSPVYWVGAGRKFPVKIKDGNKVLAKPPVETGLQSADVFLGPPNLSHYTVQADVMGTKEKRRMPDAGLIASGYTMDLMGGHQRLQIRSWASMLRIEKTIEFPWQPDTWYTMKLRVDFEGNKAIVKGKVWPKADAEPEAWTITVEDPIGIQEGSPGFYGNSGTEIFYDNIKVMKSEP